MHNADQHRRSCEQPEPLRQGAEKHNQEVDGEKVASGAAGQHDGGRGSHGIEHHHANIEPLP
jgi:hypothetical protein